MIEPVRLPSPWCDEPLTVVVPTYNEAGNLPRLVERLLALPLPGLSILVADDNSPDGTWKIVEDMGATDPRIKLLRRSGKLGLGTATIAGMKYGIEHGYDYLLNMDADFSHHPRHLPAIIAGMEDPAAGPVDVMIGSRYVKGGGVVNWPLKRKLMSRGVNLYARTLLGLRTHDCSGSYRCYRVTTLSKVDFESVISRGYSFQEEILWRLKRVGARMRETPITFADREQGQSKINSQEAKNAVKIIAQLGLRNWTGR